MSFHGWWNILLLIIGMRGKSRRMS